MFTKTKIYICMFLCLISLVSVGFSSWTITGLEEESFDVSITADKVINSKEYVYLDTTKGENNSGIDCFKYYEYGYWSEDGTHATDTGYIKTYYVLDLKKCYELFGSNYSSVNVVINLQYAEDVNTDLNLFKYQIKSSGSHDISVSCTADSNAPTVTELTSTIDQQYCISLDFKNILTNYSNIKSPEKIYFTVEYALYATTGDYFYNEIYKYLYMNMINYVSFEANLFVSGTN